MSNKNIAKEDIEFFDKLYIKYYKDICKYISVITRGKFSEDIAQETFCTAWEKIYEIKKHPSPRNWLYKTAKNKTMTAMKKKMNICETPISVEELDTYTADSPEEQSIFDDLSNILTKEEIRMLKQHFVEGYSIKEISLANSIKTGTGTMKFSRIYKKIKNSKFFNFFMLFFIMIMK